MDESSQGRRSPACAVCHYDNWYALDPIAAVLGRAVRDESGAISYIRGEKTLVLGGIEVEDTKGLIEALVNSKEFAFRSCELSFEFLYGRKPLSCEASIFDRCMKAFEEDGLIQSALSSYLKEESFCQ